MSLTVLTRTAAAAPAADTGTLQEYKVGARDVVEITVFNQPELSGKYTLRADGAFEFPLVGDVKAAGLTAGEIQSHVQKLLAAGFINNPQVNAKVIEFNSQRVFVVGEVGTPGPVKLTGNMTLLEALLSAGGASKTAGTELLVLRRPEGGNPDEGPLVAGQAGVRELARVNLPAMQSGRAKDNVALLDGDTVFVPKADVIYVTGEVITPGPITFEQDMTVLRAISLAGGANKLGADKRARIVRIINGEKTELKAKLTDALQPGDIVKVPTRLF